MSPASGKKKIQLEFSSILAENIPYGSSVSVRYGYEVARIQLGIKETVPKLKFSLTLEFECEFVLLLFLKSASSVSDFFSGLFGAEPWTSKLEAAYPESWFP